VCIEAYDNEWRGETSVFFVEILGLELAGNLSPDLDAYQESKIVPIKEGSWNLRSVLVMLEGSNTHMLEYIKAKPRWRPSFVKANDAASEEVLAFKQIYLSKAATSYRKLLAKKANEVYLEQVERMRIEDETKEHQLEAMQFHGRPNDIVRQILESHNVDDFRGDMLQSGDKHLRGSTNSDGSGNENRPSMLQKKGRQSRLIASEAPTVDQIRAKINKRRGMNAQIQMMESGQGSAGDMGDLNRRGSNLSFGPALVGEVNEAHIQNVREEQPYDAGHLLTQGHFGPTYLDRDDLSFCSRNSSRRPRVGQYRRMRSNTSQQEQFRNKPQPGLQYQESM